MVVKGPYLIQKEIKGNVKENILNAIFWKLNTSKVLNS